jgi:hypothetical protein
VPPHRLPVGDVGGHALDVEPIERFLRRGRAHRHPHFITARE